MADDVRGGGAVVCLSDDSGRARREEELSQQVKRLSDAVRRADDLLDRVTERFRPALVRMRDAAFLQEPREILGYQIDRFARAVENVWVVSRLARDALTLNVRPVELSAVLDRAVQALSPLLRARRLHLTVAMPLEPEALMGDAERLEQILTEVLDNAARYTAPGGNIRLAAERQGERVVIRVHDAGRGIDGGALERLAELSARERRFWEASEDGLGAGLALVNSLVPMQGGLFELSSGGPGHGSEAVLRLPAVPRGASAAREDAGKPTFQGPKRVLGPRATELRSDEPKR
jgi:signal transduction histidine kinase